MSDGNNSKKDTGPSGNDSEIAAQLTKQLEEERKNRKAMEDDLDKAKKSAESAQGLVDRWKGEIGEHRKEYDDAVKEVISKQAEALKILEKRNDASMKIEEKEKELEKREKALAGKSGAEGGSQGNSSQQESVEDLEKRLVSDEATKSVIDEIYNDLLEQAKGDGEEADLAQEQIDALKGDKSARYKFLQKAENQANSLRTTDRTTFWNTAPSGGNNKQTSRADQIDQLFEKNKRKRLQIPSGPDRGSDTAGYFGQRDQSKRYEPPDAHGFEVNGVEI